MPAFDTRPDVLTHDELTEEQQDHRDAADVKGQVQNDPGLQERVQSTVQLDSAEIQRGGTSATLGGKVADEVQAAVMNQLKGQIDDPQKLAEVAQLTAVYVKGMEGQIEERIKDRADPAMQGEVGALDPISKWAAQANLTADQKAAYQTLVGAFETEQEMDETIAGIEGQIERKEAEGMLVNPKSFQQGLESARASQLDRDLGMVAAIGWKEAAPIAAALGIGNLSVEERTRAMVRTLDKQAGLDVPGLNDPDMEQDFINRGRMFQQMGMQLPQGVPTGGPQAAGTQLVGPGAYAALSQNIPWPGLPAQPEASKEGGPVTYVQPSNWAEAFKLATGLDGSAEGDQFSGMMAGMLQQFSEQFGQGEGNPLAAMFSPKSIFNDDMMRVLNTPASPVQAQQPAQPEVYGPPAPPELTGGQNPDKE